MTDYSGSQWKNEDIARHLKSAMDTLTPDVLDKIDLTTHQDIHKERPKRLMTYRRMRTLALAAAACLCIVLFGGGIAKFQNSRVESIVGIDVNPSIELSVNRNNKVLSATPLNSDAVAILDQMDLKGVDLDIAMNAIIGSMVRNGYLDDLENAILVTVSNDDDKKAAALRQNVVGDIKKSLDEYKVNAVVYDQQASVTDDVKKLADKYDISYGKAYFLQELVEENNLSESDMKEFAGMTMEEIAKAITERSYHVRTDTDEEGTSSAAGTTGESHTAESAFAQSQSTLESSAAGDTSSPAAASATTAASGTQEVPSSAAQPTVSESKGDDEDDKVTAAVKIDNVDYDSGILNVQFKDKVKWKNPTVSVTGEGGSYAAKISDTSSDSCEIQIKGLEGGKDYTFVLGGVALRSGGKFSSVKGYFDTPDIAEDATEEAEDDTDTDQTTASQPAQTQPSSQGTQAQTAQEVPSQSKESSAEAALPSAQAKPALQPSAAAESASAARAAAPAVTATAADSRAVAADEAS